VGGGPCLPPLFFGVACVCGSPGSWPHPRRSIKRAPLFRSILARKDYPGISFTSNRQKRHPTTWRNAFSLRLNGIDYPAACIRKSTNSSSGSAPSKRIFSIDDDLGYRHDIVAVGKMRQLWGHHHICCNATRGDRHRVGGVHRSWAVRTACSDDGLDMQWLCRSSEFFSVGLRKRDRCGP